MTALSWGVFDRPGVAAASVLIANLAAKAKDIKTIAISIAIIIIGIVFYIYPDFIAAYIQLLLSLFIIYGGVMNIINTLHLSGKLSKYTQAITRKYNKIVSSHKKENKEKVEQKEKLKESIYIFRMNVFLRKRRIFFIMNFNMC